MFINIEIERLRRRMSKADMANRLDVTPDILNAWISRSAAIPAAKMRALSQLFGGISLDYLLCKNDTK